MSSALLIYQWITSMAAPIIYAWLWLRKLRGKENPQRFSERFGYASETKSEGDLCWLHAASVGETMSLLALIDQLQKDAPKLQLLITTGTVSSASMLQDRLPPRVIHQFVPIDTPKACKRFLDYWKPELAVLTESELWPNLILATKQRNIPMALINARMSDKSYHQWLALDMMAKTLLESFAFVAAQTPTDARKFSKIGARHVNQLGHLKQDADPLGVDEQTLKYWQSICTHRTCLIAASMHPGEEVLMAKLHQHLKKDIPDLLTVFIPRHPPKADGMAVSMQEYGLKVLQRSERTEPTADDIHNVDIYLADTIGEMGLWYRLGKLAIVGGSFIEHGGQNPIEAIQLNTAVITGPHTENFDTVIRELLRCDGIIQLHDNDISSLYDATKELLMNESAHMHQTKCANEWLAKSPPVASRLSKELINIMKGNKT